MPKDLTSDIQLTSADGKPVQLPSGESISNAEFLRDGQDLYLQSPDGHSVKIEGYFDHTPDIVTADGGHLSPSMVQSFLPPSHPGEYAAADKPVASDATPVGKITELTGEATIMRGGEKITIAVGTEVFQGDVIQTAKDGAVSILFADNTTFAISHDAKLAIDQFVYNASEQEGSSFFSMLQGMFVYTSGLIGKDDPGHVGINTPVGSIGIRGTVVAGNIMPAGQESTITIVDGAIVITNGGGTLEMGDAFDTATLTAYAATPTDSGQMDGNTFSATYGTLAPVAGQTFDNISNGVYQPPAQTTPAPDAPDAPNAPSTPDAPTQQDAAPPPAGVPPQDAPLHAPDVPPPPVMNGTQALPGEAPLPPPPPSGSEMPLQMPMTTPPPPAAGFTDSSQTNFGDAGTSTFTPTTQAGGTTAGTGTGGTAALPPTQTTPPPTGTTSDGAPFQLKAGFAFEPALYMNNTPNQGDDGIPLFAIGWPGTPVDVGKVVWNTLNPVTVTLSGLDVNGDVLGRQAVYNTATTGNTFDVTGSTTANFPLFHFDAASHTLQLTDPLGMGVNGNFNFTVTVTDTVTNQTAEHSFVVQLRDQGMNILVGDPSGSVPLNPAIAAGDNITGTGANDFIWGRDGDDVLIGAGGNDVLVGDAGNDILAQNVGGHARMYGGAGNDILVVKDDPGLDGPSYFDGGTGNDILQLGSTTTGGTALNFDLTTNKNIFSIEYIQLADADATAGTTEGQNLVLNLADVFAMTDGTHMLSIGNMGTGYGSNVTVNLAGMTGVTQANIGNTGNGTISGQLISNGATVTLVIQQGAHTSTDGILVTVN